MAHNWLTLEQAAAEIGRSASTLRRQALSGALKAHKSGGIWYVHRRDLAAYRRRTQVRDSGARLLVRPKTWPEERPEQFTEREWHALVEHVRHDRTLADIAAELGVTPPAVGQALNSAVRKYLNNPW